MKIYRYIFVITVALLVSMPTYAAELPADPSNHSSEDFKETGNESEPSEGSESSEGTGNESEPSEGSESSEGTGNESEPSEEFENLNQPISESDIGDSVDTAELEPAIVDEPIYFDNNIDFDNNVDSNRNDEQVLATPIPAAIWLFATGLLGLSSRAKRRKKT